MYYIDFNSQCRSLLLNKSIPFKQKSIHPQIIQLHKESNLLNKYLLNEQETTLPLFIIFYTKQLNFEIIDKQKNVKGILILQNFTLQKHAQQFKKSESIPTNYKSLSSLLIKGWQVVHTQSTQQSSTFLNQLLKTFKKKQKNPLSLYQIKPQIISKQFAQFNGLNEVQRNMAGMLLAIKGVSQTKAIFFAKKYGTIGRLIECFKSAGAQMLSKFELPQQQKRLGVKFSEHLYNSLMSKNK